MANEVAGWAAGKGKTRPVRRRNGEAKVQPLGGLVPRTVGQEIVLPTEGTSWRRCRTTRDPEGVGGQEVR